MANLLKAVNTLASGATVYQERRNHFDSLQEEESMHRHTMSEMQDQFNKELQEARRIYLLSMYADMETYFQELNENLISSSRDAERDMVDQRNQQFQTILISATIMLATLLNIMFQGDLPENIHWMFYAGYALFNTISLISLTINVALCILITSRVTKFMYRKSDANIKHLKKAMRHTKDMMRNLRGSGRSSRFGTSDHEAENTNQQRDDVPAAASNGSNCEPAETSQPSSTRMPSAFPSLSELPPLDANMPQDINSPGLTQGRTNESLKSSQRPKLRPQFSFSARSNTSTSTLYPDPPSPLRPALVSVRRNIAMLKDDEVDQEWKRHEREVTEYLTHRSRLAERLEAMAVEQENQERMSFELFWAKYCRAMANSALILFYLGTICLLIGTMIFSWTLLVQEYSSVISAIASVATIGASLVICAGLAIYLRFFDSSIVVLNAQLAREQHQHAKKYWTRMWDTLRSSHLVFSTHVDVDSKEN